MFAELFMIKGLLIFDPEPGHRAHGRDSVTGELAVPRWNLALVRSLACPLSRLLAGVDACGVLPVRKIK